MKTQSIAIDLLFLFLFFFPMYCQVLKKLVISSCSQFLTATWLFYRLNGSHLPSFLIFFFFFWNVKGKIYHTMHQLPVPILWMFYGDKPALFPAACLRGIWMQSVPIGTMNMSPGRAAGLHTISATELFSARSDRCGTHQNAFHSW